ncbi:MAG TPA: metallopeptidase TldD-related protein, partial [Bryobacteraceae bacterium]|nr:metallopeptidase TldD-related protein [Bryobacteraceae bacterium]
VVRLTPMGVTMPIDDSYDEVRRQLWLATDSAYKTALDTYAKKKAALEHRTRQDGVPDFSHEPVIHDEEIEPHAGWRQEDVESLVKMLSALFREVPGIDNSAASFRGQEWLVRYVNSEGTSYTRQKSLITLQISADTQAADGMPLADYEIMYARSVAGLPPRDEMVRRVRALGARLSAQRKAELIDRYAGPVLFEGQAAGELFLETVGASLTGNPRTVVDDVRFEGMFSANAGLNDKIGSRILPESISLKDAPSARELQGQPLFGSYQVDDDGVKAGETELIDKGILKALLHNRGLIPNTTHSTASRRGYNTSPSNLIVTVDKPMTAAQLKAELIRIVQQRGKEYGVVVRRISNQQLSYSPLRSRVIMSSAGNAPGTLRVQPLAEAYKVFPDGHEEPLRNLEVTSLTMADFRNILAFSEPTPLYTATVQILNRTPVANISFIQPGGPMEVSANVPSMLFEDVTLAKPTGDVPIPPFSTHPFFNK